MESTYRWPDVRGRRHPPYRYGRRRCPRGLTSFLQRGDREHFSRKLIVPSFVKTLRQLSASSERHHGSDARTAAARSCPLSRVLRMVTEACAETTTATPASGDSFSKHTAEGATVCVTFLLDFWIETKAHITIRNIK